VYVQSPFLKSGLEGATVGAGVSLFKTIWNNFLMPLLTPADTTTPSLQKSKIARLYPAEIASHINQAAGTTAAAGVSFGALSGRDVGPYALGGPQDYPDVAQALRARAGLQDQYPSLQNTWGTGGPGGEYPTAAQAMGVGADVTAPNATVVAPPATVVAPPATPPATPAAAVADIASTLTAALPGIAPAAAQQAAATVVSAPAATPMDVHAALQRALPGVHPPHLRAAADTVHRRIRQHHQHRMAGGAAPAPGATIVAPPAQPAPVATPVVAPSAMQQPGPPPSPIGPQAMPNSDPQCGCIGENNPYLGFIGDSQEKDNLYLNDALGD
jgi:hypothetical protein